MDSKVVYWHRELPPVDADAIGDHTIEAVSDRVQGTLAHRDDMWDRCYRELMDRAGLRLEQEIERLGGDYAHVVSEDVGRSRSTPAVRVPRRENHGDSI